IRRSCVNPDTRKGRFLTQRRRNMRLQSRARLIRKLWTPKFCQKSKLFLSFRATSPLGFFSQMEFTLTNWCSKFLTKNLIKQLIHFLSVVLNFYRPGSVI
uniref:Uncharacterized protein n=3 Tax=Canis lupus TaxID=9612 RepID=A0A8C0P966_CANLF